MDLAGIALTGLERSCTTVGEGVIAAPSASGLARMEARFSGNAFSPHRHDTYAIGLTMWGVQSFRYRGFERRSLAGQILVLHPDEVHDGGAGTDAGLVYRMLYVDPDLIRRALPARRGEGLPFVREPVFHDQALQGALMRAFSASFEATLDPLLVDEIVAGIADGLHRRADAIPVRGGPLDTMALEAARAFLSAQCTRTILSDELERETGLDRFTLARQFRRAFGTSPYRYASMRRLSAARDLIARGEPLADVAAATGFADQSHLTRQFRQAFGLSPGRWARLVAFGRSGYAGYDQAASDCDSRLST